MRQPLIARAAAGKIQLSPSCPFRRLHTFHFLRPARLRTPLLGYGAPHLSARGTLTLLNNALLSAHFRLADKPGVGLLWFTLQRLANRDQENGTLAFCVRGKEVNYIVVEEG